MVGSLSMIRRLIWPNSQYFPFFSYSSKFALTRSEMTSELIALLEFIGRNRPVSMAEKQLMVAMGHKTDITHIDCWIVPQSLRIPYIQIQLDHALFDLPPFLLQAGESEV
jgi:hypothetical protein